MQMILFAFLQVLNTQSSKAVVCQIWYLTVTANQYVFRQL